MKTIKVKYRTKRYGKWTPVSVEVDMGFKPTRENLLTFVENNINSKVMQAELDDRA